MHAWPPPAGTLLDHIDEARYQHVEAGRDAGGCADHSEHAEELAAPRGMPMVLSYSMASMKVRASISLPGVRE